LLDAFPGLPVTAVDRLEHRVRMLQTVAAGGVTQLIACEADAGALPFTDDRFDVMTALEVLEHIPEVEKAAWEIVRVARRHIVISVPSHADNNPEHLHLLSEADLRRLFQVCGVRRIGFEHVHNHLIAVITKGD
jgi:ubiquinone/menaquinone biosynthesis C-methylase UbiE